MAKIVAALAVAATLGAGCGTDSGGSDKKVSADPNSADYVNPDLINACEKEHSADDCREIWGH